MSALRARIPNQFVTVIDTQEGKVQIATNRKWLGIFCIPHTSVLPHPCNFGDLRRLGISIKWTTDDPWVLEKLHESIVRVVQEAGVSGMVEIRNSARLTERVWKAAGGVGSGLQDMVQMANEEGVNFPLPADVLKYLKSFQ